MRMIRKSIPPLDHSRRSLELVHAISSQPEWQHATTVMLFVGIHTEPDTTALRALAHGEGKRVVLPRVVRPNIVAMPDSGKFEVSSFGVPEPVGEVVVPPGEIDVVIVPGLAFDQANFRLGYGGGFYDRFLPSLRCDAVTIGIGFSEQIVDEVPRHDGDIALTRVVVA